MNLEKITVSHQGRKTNAYEADDRFFLEWFSKRLLSKIVSANRLNIRKRLIRLLISVGAIDESKN